MEDMLFQLLGAIGLVTALPAFAHRPAPTVGLMVVAHGASREWNDQVKALVDQVDWPAGPVGLTFLMGEDADANGWRATMQRLVGAGARTVVVVPLMISSYGGHYRQVLYYAGKLPALPPELSAHAHESPFHPIPVAVTPALDAAPELAEALLLQRPNLRRDVRPLVLLGHGPNAEEDAKAWLNAFTTTAERLVAAGHRGTIRLALLRDDAPAGVREAAVAALRDTVHALAGRSQDTVTVMTVLVASGRMTRVRIPKDLEGLPVDYVPSVLAPLPPIARWIERVAATAVRTAD